MLLEPLLQCFLLLQLVSQEVPLHANRVELLLAPLLQTRQALREHSQLPTQASYDLLIVINDALLRG